MDQQCIVGGRVSTVFMESHVILFHVVLTYGHHSIDHDLEAATRNSVDSRGSLCLRAWRAV